MTSVLTALALDPRETVEDHAAHRHAAVAIIGALHPNDAVQHMLAARTAAAHFTAMECFRRAGLPDQPDAGLVCLVRIGEAMDRMSVRSMDRLKRCQSEAADRRRPFTAGLAAGIVKAGCNYPMSSEKSASGAAPQAAMTAPSETCPSATHPSEIGAPAAHQAPIPPHESGHNNHMPSENPMAVRIPWP
jgi:hypothetical protein